MLYFSDLYLVLSTSEMSQSFAVITCADRGDGEDICIG